MPVKQGEWDFAHAQRALARGRASDAEKLCARRVTEAPHDAAAWHLLGLARQKLRSDTALAALSKAAALARDNAHYQHDLGNAFAEAGKADRAITAFRRALRLDDSMAEVHNDLGTAYFEKQWYEQAEQCFLSAIRLRPDHGVAHANLGAALRAQGRLVEGRRAFQRALILKLRAALPSFLRWRVGDAVEQRDARKACLEIARAAEEGNLPEARRRVMEALERFPASAEVNFVAHQVLERLGEPDQAAAFMRKAVELDPRRAAYQIALARMCLRREDASGAVAAAEAAAYAQPDSAEAQSVLSLALRMAKQLDASERAARRSIELDPERAESYVDLALVMRAKEWLDEAERQMREAIRLAPQEPGHRLNLALIMRDAGRTREAIDLYRSLAEEFNRRPAPAAHMYLSLGSLALECEGDLDAARRWYRIAEERGETNRAAMSQAVADLLEWRFEPGWRNFEARRTVAEQRERHDQFAGFPRWNGVRLEGKRLLVYGEQGVGDEILFASMMADLQKSAPTLTLTCDARLRALFARSFPAVEVLRASYETVAAVRDRVDYAVAAGSLGQYFRRTPADFPNRRGYLKTDPEGVARWHERIPRPPQGIKVGVSWAGGLQHTGRHRRSLTLEDLAPLLDMPGITWVSLQHGDAGRTTVRSTALHTFPGVTDDMDELASLVDSLDAVVTVCNTTVHVAGAVGKPVLVMAPLVPLWSYGVKGERMLWYPSVRVFRQAADREWQPVVRRVAEALRDFKAT